MTAKSKFLGKVSWKRRVHWKIGTGPGRDGAGLSTDETGLTYVEIGGKSPFSN